jgi:hypothetical protein
MIGDEEWGMQVAKVARRLFPILLVAVLAGMLVFFGSIAIGNGSSESRLGHDLKSRGVRTVGTVTATGEHDYFSYSFMVEGSQYSGNTNAFLAGQTLDAGQLHLGQHIPVIYDAKDPHRSCSCDVNLMTSTAWSGELFPLFFVIFGTVVVGVGMLSQWRRRQRASGSGPAGVGPTRSTFTL